MGDPVDEILAAAGRLFGELGVGGTTMSRIAKDVGLRQSSLHYYFSRKEEIVATLVARADVLSLELIERISDEGVQNWYRGGLSTPGWRVGTEMADLTVGGLLSDGALLGAVRNAADAADAADAAGQRNRGTGSAHPSQMRCICVSGRSRPTSSCTRRVNSWGRS